MIFTNANIVVDTIYENLFLIYSRDHISLFLNFLSDSIVDLTNMVILIILSYHVLLKY
jgi:hypothetical protein